MTNRPTIAAFSLLCLSFLGCGITAFVDDPASVSGVSYWAAATHTLVPTETRYVGHTTAVYAETPIPNVVTQIPAWTTVTVTPIAWATPTRWGTAAAAVWATTTPVFITETPQPPQTTTPALPRYGFTTPEPRATAYYRVGSFYMNSDVIVRGEGQLVFRIVYTSQVANLADTNSQYFFVTVRITNQGDRPQRVIASDLFFIREVRRHGITLTGRWTPQNEPLLRHQLPSYETQQLAPLAPSEQRTITLGFVLPTGDVEQLGLVTNWQHPVTGGTPIWFYLEDDPAGPFVDAISPPPPTALFLDTAAALGGAADSSSSQWGRGRWPTTGTVTRGFGCEPFFTGVHGAGFGCPADRPWFHNGIDIANTAGTAIWSPMDGTVVYAGPHPTGPDCSHIAGSVAPHSGLGNYQTIAGRDTVHYLGHLSAFTLTQGRVVAEQPTATMGSTGCSTGTHLHWMVFHNGSLIDPALWAGEGP